MRRLLVCLLLVLPCLVWAGGKEEQAYYRFKVKGRSWGAIPPQYQLQLPVQKPQEVGVLWKRGIKDHVIKLYLTSIGDRGWKVMVEDISTLRTYVIYTSREWNLEWGDNVILQGSLGSDKVFVPRVVPQDYIQRRNQEEFAAPFR